MLGGKKKSQLGFKLWHLSALNKKQKTANVENEHWSLISLPEVHPHFITLFLLLCICKAFRLRVNLLVSTVQY